MIDSFVVLVVQLAVLLTLAVLLGQAAQRLGLPAIIGELLAGLVVGQTILGQVLPTGYAALFPKDPTETEVRTEFLKVGLLLFIFLVGLDVDLNLVAQRIGSILPTSLGGIVIPFLGGFASVMVFPGLWHTVVPQASLRLSLMVGVALSVSALPVIARILSDLGLIRTKIGGFILSAAIVDDLVGWLAFALLISTLAPTEGSGGGVGRAIVVVLLTFAVAVTLGRRIAARVRVWVERHPRNAGLVLALVLALVLLAGGVMENIGVHAFFGALTVGLAASALDETFFEPVTRVVRYFFAPLYFGSVALGVNFFANFDVVLIASVICIATIGKLVGVTLGARLGGLHPRDALAVATGMNARGAVEILLATLARQSGLIDDRIFVALVVMALTTSVLAGSLIKRVLKVSPPANLVKSTVPVLQLLDQDGRPIEEVEIGQRLTIGRSPANRLALEDDELASREHAVIRQVDDRYRIEDLGSKNGTLIWGGTRWQKVGIDELHDGDILVIGSNAFRFSPGTGGEAPASAHSATPSARAV